MPTLHRARALTTRLFITYPLLGSLLGLLPFENLLCEASRSLAHYWLIFHGVGALLLLFGKHALRRSSAALCTLLLVSCSIAYSQHLLPFYRSSVTNNLIPERPPEAAPVIRVLYVNIDVYNSDYERLARILEREQPDVVVILEAHGKWPNIIAEKSGLPYELHRQDRLVGRLVFSRFPIEEIPLPAQLASYASVAHLRLQISSEYSLSLLSLDAFSPVDQMLLEGRNSYLRAVAPFAAAISGDVVALGDLNSTIFSPNLRDFFKEAALTNAAYGFGFHSTWHLKKLPFIRAQIDHVAYRGNLHVRNFQVLEDVGSDHSPILLAIQPIPAARSKK